MRRLGTVLALVAVGGAGLGLWLQPRSDDEALCYWLQRQLDGTTSVIDKVACKQEAVKQQEQRRREDEQRRRELEQRRWDEAQRERIEWERQVQVEAQHREREKCLDEAELRYGPRAEAAEARWQDLNHLPPDQTEAEYEAHMRKFEEVDAEWQAVTAEWEAVREACWEY